MTNAFKAVAALIKATRDVHVPSVNVQLEGLDQGGSQSFSARLNREGQRPFVRLNFGGSNSAYYLDAVDRSRQGHPATAAQELQEAQAAELAARESLAQFDIVPPANQAVVATINPAAAPGYQLMMVQVPAGLAGGQSLQVQTPAGLMTVQIPPGLTAGQSSQMQVNAAVAGLGCPSPKSSFKPHR